MILELGRKASHNASSAVALTMNPVSLVLHLNMYVRAFSCENFLPERHLFCI